MRCSYAEVSRALNTTGIPATGTVSAQAQIGGTTANPLAEFHVQAADLVAYNELFGTLSRRRTLQRRGSVEVSSLSLDKPQEGGNGRITGTLSYQLGSERYAMNVRSANVRCTTLQLPDGRRVTGGLDLVAQGSGTVPSPAGAINLRASDLIAGEYQLGRLSADTTLANGQATTITTAPGLGLNAKSAIVTTAPYQATISATIFAISICPRCR